MENHSLIEAGPFLLPRLLPIPTNKQPVALVASSCPAFCLQSAGQKVRQTFQMTEDTFVEEFDDTSTFENKAGLAEVS